MSDADSPKVGARPTDAPESLFAGAGAPPFTPPPTLPRLEVLESQLSVTESQPSVTDLVQAQLDISLDPNTPRDRRHKAAERVLTTGKAAQVLRTHLDAVVKVFCTHARPNWELPWQMRQQSNSNSTGFAVAAGAVGRADRWLLTNAHSVTFAVGGGVYVKRRADDTRFEARVLAVGTECDVALLTVDDDAFWESVVPLELGAELPELQASLAVVGYPIGGASLAISAGVVSRVGMVHYSHGAMSLLCIQSDAAINSGNSGGPVLDSQGACVGIAFQSLTGDAQNVGYIVPSCVVLHFLQDFARSGSFNSFPSLNITWQELESKALKRAHGLGEREKGVLVRSVAAAAAEAAGLRPDDILQRIDGVEVGSDGTVPFRHGERVAFSSLISSKFCGDEVELSLLRAGERLTARVALSYFQHLVPPHNSERKPTYLQVGGLVFTRLVDPYLAQRYGSLHSAPVRLLNKTYYGLKSRPDEEVVVLSNVLACAATAGYDSTVGIRDGALAAFNGEKVWNMLGLARAVEAACAAGAGCEFLCFDLETGKTVVLEAAVARRCTGEVAESNSMKASMSADLAAALARGGAAAAE